MIFEDDLNQIHKIEDNLYIGNSIASKNFEKLLSNGITHILVVGSFLKCHFRDKFVYKQRTVTRFTRISISHSLIFIL